MPRSVCLLVAGCLALLAAAPSAADVEIGKPAPPMDLLGSDGERYTLERFQGKRGFVLAWFPKAFTPG